jgi:hypothetical protein
MRAPPRQYRPRAERQSSFRACRRNVGQGLNFQCRQRSGPTGIFSRARGGGDTARNLHCVPNMQSQLLRLTIESIFQRWPAPVVGDDERWLHAGSQLRTLFLPADAANHNRARCGGILSRVLECRRVPQAVEDAGRAPKGADRGRESSMHLSDDVWRADRPTSLRELTAACASDRTSTPQRTLRTCIP